MLGVFDGSDPCGTSTPSTNCAMIICWGCAGRIAPLAIPPLHRNNGAICSPPLVDSADGGMAGIRDAWRSAIEKARESSEKCFTISSPWKPCPRHIRRSAPQAQIGARPKSPRSKCAGDTAGRKTRNGAFRRKRRRWMSSSSILAPGVTALRPRPFGQTTRIKAARSLFLCPYPENVYRRERCMTSAKALPAGCPRSSRRHRKEWRPHAVISAPAVDVAYSIGRRLPISGGNGRG